MNFLQDEKRRGNIECSIGNRDYSINGLLDVEEWPEGNTSHNNYSRFSSVHRGRMKCR